MVLNYVKNWLWRINAHESSCNLVHLLLGRPGTQLSCNWIELSWDVTQLGCRPLTCRFTPRNKIVKFSLLDKSVKKGQT